MKRFIVFRELRGSRVSHGTLLYSELEKISITSHPLDDALGVEYFVSLSGLARDALRVVSKTERNVLVEGSEAASISPYLYEIVLEEPKED